MLGLVCGETIGVEHRLIRLKELAQGPAKASDEHKKAATDTPSESDRSEPGGNNGRMLTPGREGCVGCHALHDDPRKSKGIDCPSDCDAKGTSGVRLTLTDGMASTGEAPVTRGVSIARP